MFRSPFLLLSAAVLGALVAGFAQPLLAPRPAAAQALGGQPFQAVLLLKPDDKDYLVVKAPDGMRVLVTDVVAYNAADGKGHRVPANAESYVWLGGYADGKSVGLINRMRVLGNETQQWRLTTPLMLSGAPELLASSEKGLPEGTPTLLYVNGVFTR